MSCHRVCVCVCVSPPSRDEAKKALRRIGRAQGLQGILIEENLKKWLPPRDVRDVQVKDLFRAFKGLRFCVVDTRVLD